MMRPLALFLVVSVGLAGGSTTYTLTFGDHKPSERARQFKRRIMRARGVK